MDKSKSLAWAMCVNVLSQPAAYSGKFVNQRNNFWIAAVDTFPGAIEWEIYGEIDDAEGLYAQSEES